MKKKKKKLFEMYNLLKKLKIKKKINIYKKEETSWTKSIFNNGKYLV